jgi:phosphatidylcholine synthase
MLAVLAVSQHRWTEAMLWLFVALVVDGLDGTLARAARVKELTPRIDGDVLDLVIDFLNYVFVPALFIWEAGLLPGTFAFALAALIPLSSLYVFARRDMKTEDGYFRGFPALWNIVALYLYATGLRQEAAAFIVAVLIILTFAPLHFVHPFRVRDYGAWLPVLAIGWAAATLALLLPGIPEALRPLLLVVSSMAALAIVSLGLLRSLRGPRGRITTGV